MHKQKRLIPFALHPVSWFKFGQSRLEAQLDYYYTDQDEKHKVKLELMLSSGKISKDQYNKDLATLNKQPYVNVIEMGMNPDMVTQGYFELDWNDEFVKMLQGAGLTGKTDEDIVNQWFNAVCRTVLNQEIADQDYGFNDAEVNRGVIRKQDPPK